MTKSRRYLFSWPNINRIPSDYYGVYSFWANHICIYVGKAERQSIRTRLMQHYSESHNKDLKLWFESSIPIEFMYEAVSYVNAIPAKERNRIREYVPITNVIYNSQQRI